MRHFVLAACIQPHRRLSKPSQATPMRRYQSLMRFAGHSRAAWEQISGFYNFWLNFSTSKAFAWADQYNPASAPNRKVTHSILSRQDCIPLRTA